MKIPYGMSNFADVRREDYFYIDKTSFLAHLESGDAGYRHLIFLRPRRMGKSLLLSMMELTTVLQEGHIQGKLVEQFGAKSVSTQEQFLSLLYYIGMLTLSARQDDPTRLRLEIPNRVIRELSWTHMAYLLEEQENLGLDSRDLEEALRVIVTDLQAGILPRSMES